MTAQWDRKHKARKDYHCAECHDGIKAGDVYMDHFQIGDGAGFSWKACVRCEAAAEWLIGLRRSYDDEYTIGNLWEAILMELDGSPIPPALNAPRFLTHVWRVWLTADSFLTRYSGKPGVGTNIALIGGHQWDTEAHARKFFTAWERASEFPDVRFVETAIGHPRSR